MENGESPQNPIDKQTEQQSTQPGRLKNFLNKIKIFMSPSDNQEFGLPTPQERYKQEASTDPVSQAKRVANNAEINNQMREYRESSKLRVEGSEAVAKAEEILRQSAKKDPQ